MARFGPGQLWDSQAISWLAITANVVVGLGWVLAHAAYLRSVDELQRKIMLEAMAVALAVGLVGGFAYAAANHAELVTVEADIAFFSTLLGVVYAVASVAGTLRYR